MQVLYRTLDPANPISEDELYAAYKILRERWHKWFVLSENAPGWRHILKTYFYIEVMVEENLALPRGFKFKPLPEIVRLSDQIVYRMKCIIRRL